MMTAHAASAEPRALGVTVPDAERVLGSPSLPEVGMRIREHLDEDLTLTQLEVSRGLRWVLFFAAFCRGTRLIFR
jgi:hypothetical protein